MKIAAIEHDLECLEAFPNMRPDFWGPEAIEAITAREARKASLEVERQKIFWKIRLGIENQYQAVRVEKVEIEINAIEAEKPRFDGLRIN